MSLYNMSFYNEDWRQKLTNFNGMFRILNGISDFHYIPNDYIRPFIDLAKKMYDNKIFLECAVHTTFGIISAEKNHVIYIRPLWSPEDRNNALNVLREEFQQICIHPINSQKMKIKKE